ncbi:sarcosine oxidase subunit gamma [Acuticoccus sp. I52.16.1]|uniref:sarcosine oxidase subunit gamma n=1 Tax=Acuticoccus sp. I52.16.1 TaxID=2928472 RepID=UPI001FD0663F|nr:sarcosine oxidase subunit gamma [Acuticoccus sp. I52.16.1]UOM34998.1 sarcosine oxidase subunit gamma [Acuticoccus sp. I52.16.1]
MAEMEIVRRLAPLGRFSLRLDEADREAAAAAIAVPLGGRIGTIAEAGARRSLRLAPDEWFLAVPLQDVTSVADAWAGAGIVGSLVEITNREVSFAIAEPVAEDVLAHGCPRDLSAMAPGRGARTVFDGVDVVLWRFEDRFEMDLWPSFAPFVEALLRAATREMAAAG